MYEFEKIRFINSFVNFQSPEFADKDVIFDYTTNDFEDIKPPDENPEIENISIDNLIAKTNEGLPQKKWKKYHKLVSKMRAETLEAEEINDLIEISEALEKINNRRFANVCKLADLQNSTVTKLLKQYVCKTKTVFEKNLSPEVYKSVLRKARGRCEYCKARAKYSFVNFSVELIKPGSKFGKAEINNLVYYCNGCRNRKLCETRAFDPITGESVFIFDPRKDKWNKHFVWSDDKLKIIGLTAKGRATVTHLNFNREEQITLRILTNDLK